MNDFSSQGTQSSLKPHIPCEINIWTCLSIVILVSPVCLRKFAIEFLVLLTVTKYIVFGSYANCRTLGEEEEDSIVSLLVADRLR